MNTRYHFLATAMFLAAVNAGVGQSTIQFSSTSYTVAESAGAVTLTLELLH